MFESPIFDSRHIHDSTDLLASCLSYMPDFDVSPLYVHMFFEIGIYIF